jgi:hypothetical protein
MSVEEHVRYTRFSLDDESTQDRLLLVDGTDLGYDNVIIKTTNAKVNNILDGLKGMLSHQLLPMYDSLKLRITGINAREIHETSQWTNFCYDLLLVYCLRKILTNEPIPILASYVTRFVGIKGCILCSSHAALKCGKCSVQYCSAKCQRADWKIHKAECVLVSEQKQYANMLV